MTMQAALPVRDRIVALLSRAPERPATIADSLGISPVEVDEAIDRMTLKGLLTPKGDGRFALAERPTNG